jgi:hypothetical protein
MQVTSNKSVVRIDMLHGAWEPIGYNNKGESPYVRLMGPPLQISGCHLHVMAHQVVRVVVAADPAMQKELDALQMLTEGALDTVFVDGREYVIVTYPYTT